MSWSEGFPAETGPHTIVLILGSMPGIKSLEQSEYYAHPRNAFWRIMNELFDIPVSDPYQQRIKALKKCHVGLWDVYKACYREGSLDANIDKKSADTNDFVGLLQDNPGIKAICFNGQAAAKSFRKNVDETGLNISLIDLPSTSPANATLSFRHKLEYWKVVKSIVEKNLE